MIERIEDEDARALGEGSEEALTRVYRALSGPLHAFLRRATSSEETARDLLQETWLRVIRAPRAPARGDEIRPWVFRIAYRLAVDHWRRRRRERPLPEAAAAVEWADPRTEAEAREMREIIEAAVGALPPGQRAVFLLREEAGIPFREVAQILGIPLGTALARMRYALSRLKRTLRGAVPEANR